MSSESEATLEKKLIESKSFSVKESLINKIKNLVIDNVI